jgi:D-lactate dehydrogenase
VIVSLFDTHSFDRTAFEAANVNFGHELRYFEVRLEEKTALLASGSNAVCAFVNDTLNRPTLAALKQVGVRLIALRSAGYNHVDLAAAGELGLVVARVPEYSPYAVAEHAVALLLTLNRKLHRAYNRVRDFNFSLDGLVGFDLHGKTVGIVGTGKIGAVFAQIMSGFGCKLIAYDVAPRKDLPVTYVTAAEIMAKSDILSFHVPLLPTTHHFLNAPTKTRRCNPQYQPGSADRGTRPGGRPKIGPDRRSCS